ncbi:hypothetical protein BD408DRAFT_456172 [Parasitella parasitica]|nr:hypothetical protein BD408DRAFT_456172 [Parasitella parasitica]
MKVVELKKERDLQYNVYTLDDPNQLNESHKTHLINFFDENSTATVQDTVEDLIMKFKRLNIKKSSVAEFMKEECNHSIKVVSRHYVQKSRRKPLKMQIGLKNGCTMAWITSRTVYLLTKQDLTSICVVVRGWSPRDSKAITETPSTKATSRNV